MSPLLEQTGLKQGMSAALRAHFDSAAFAPTTAVGWLRVTGEDRVRWLNGMTTNSILELKPGEGCYTFFLNAQGRIQADAIAWLREDAILLETGNPATLATVLDRFIIMDDVELEVIVGRAGLQVAGPLAEALLTTLRIAPGAASLGSVTALWQAQSVDVLHAYSPLVPTFELWSDPATIGLLAESLRALGAIEATAGALTQLRILSGTPLYGVDIRDKDLPQETGQTRALHFSKGCYLGQEIVERIHSRGNVHRAFSGFILDGEMPAPNTTLASAEAPDKPIGELTSITRIGQRLYALGYVRREALERNATLTYSGGTAVPTSLPFPNQT